MGFSSLFWRHKKQDKNVPLKGNTHSVYHLEHQEVIYKRILVFQPPQQPQATSIGHIQVALLLLADPEVIYTL